MVVVNVFFQQDCFKLLDVPVVISIVFSDIWGGKKTHSSGSQRSPIGEAAIVSLFPFGFKQGIFQFI